MAVRPFSRLLKVLKPMLTRLFGVLSALSLGDVPSYKIFDEGIDLRTVDSILAAQEITVIYEALS